LVRSVRARAALAAAPTLKEERNSLPHLKLGPAFSA
jgi:hypothetical protein